MRKPGRGGERRAATETTLRDGGLRPLCVPCSVLTNQSIKKPSVAFYYKKIKSLFITGDTVLFFFFLKQVFNSRNDEKIFFLIQVTGFKIKKQRSDHNPSLISFVISE